MLKKIYIIFLSVNCFYPTTCIGMGIDLENYSSHVPPAPPPSLNSSPNASDPSSPVCTSSFVGTVYLKHASQMDTVRTGRKRSDSAPLPVIWLPPIPEHYIISNHSPVHHTISSLPKHMHQCSSSLANTTLTGILVKSPIIARRF